MRLISILFLIVISSFTILPFKRVDLTKDVSIIFPGTPSFRQITSNNVHSWRYFTSTCVYGADWQDVGEYNSDSTELANYLNRTANHIMKSGNDTGELIYTKVFTYKGITGREICYKTRLEELANQKTIVTARFFFYKKLIYTISFRSLENKCLSEKDKYFESLSFSDEPTVNDKSKPVK